MCWVPGIPQINNQEVMVWEPINPLGHRKSTTVHWIQLQLYEVLPKLHKEALMYNNLMTQTFHDGTCCL